VFDVVKDLVLRLWEWTATRDFDIGEIAVEDRIKARFLADFS
jgi:hypothetical protein